MNKKLVLNSIIKTTIQLFIILVILAIIIDPWATSPYTSQIQRARDKMVISDMSKIEESLKNIKSYNFSSLEDYNIKYNMNIRPPKMCYYIKSSEDNNSYILVAPLESSKFKKEYWNDYYIYKSNPNYIIDENIFQDIKKTIDIRCK